MQPCDSPRSSESRGRGVHSAMRRKKQADSEVGLPIEQWAVAEGVVSVMGITIEAALAMAPVDRDLHVVELWAGVASIVKAARAHDYRAAAFDLNRCPGVTDVLGEGCEDITTREGFIKAIMLVLRLGEGGLLAMGPDCSSFTFPNSSRHKRKVGAECGDLQYSPVILGNLMAVIALFLCQLAVARRVHVGLENPPDSYIFRFFERLCPQLMSVKESRGQAQLMGANEESGHRGFYSMTVHRCAYDDSPSPKIQKTYKWLASWSKIKGLNGRCTCQGSHRRCGRTDAEGAWSGNSAILAESAAYPDRLGRALLASWMQGCAINASWSKEALAFTWVDPRDEDVPGFQRVKSSRLTPQDDIVDSYIEQETSSSVMGSGSRRPELSSPFGPWASTTSSKATVANARLGILPGPWDAVMPTTSTSSSDRTSVRPVEGSRSHRQPSLGPWASTSSSRAPLAKSQEPVQKRTPAGGTSQSPWDAVMPMSSSSTPATSSTCSFGPWGASSIAKPPSTQRGNTTPSSSEEDGDVEAAPGQIGSPK